MGGKKEKRHCNSTHAQTFGLFQTYTRRCMQVNNNNNNAITDLTWFFCLSTHPLLVSEAARTIGQYAAGLRS